MKKIYGLTLIGVSAFTLASCKEDLPINNYSNATLDVTKFVPDTFEAGYNQSALSSLMTMSNVDNGDTSKTESFDKITSGAAEVQKYADMFMDLFDLYKAFLAVDDIYEYTLAGTSTYLLLEEVEERYDGEDVNGHRVSYLVEYTTGKEQSGMINFYNYSNGEILFDAYFTETSGDNVTSLRLQYSNDLLRFYLQSETALANIIVAREYQSINNTPTMSEYGYVDLGAVGITEYYLTASGDEEYGYLTGKGTTTAYGNSLEFSATEIYETVENGADAQLSYIHNYIDISGTKYEKGIFPLQSVDGWLSYTGSENMDEYGEVNNWSLITTNEEINQDSFILNDMYYAQSYDRTRGLTDIQRKVRDIASICRYAQSGNESVYNVSSISTDLTQSIEPSTLKQLVEGSVDFHNNAKFNNDNLTEIDNSVIKDYLNATENNEMSSFEDILSNYLEA